MDGETHYSGWSLTDSFTMPEECVAPENPQITQLAPFSALLSWDGGGEYEYVEYREGTGEYQTAFSCDFTATTSLNGWTIRSNESNTWERIQLSNQRFMRSNIEGTMGVHDHWLITPQIEFPGRLSFKARRGSSNAPLYVYVSVTDTEQGSFTRVQTIQLTTSYQTFTIDLTEYAGAGYVAFVHNFTVLDPNTGTPPTYQAMVDDVAYQGLVYGEWISAGVIEDDDCINLYDLTPGTTYQARVRTHCDTGYDSEWTEHVTFSTPGNIVFEDSFVKLACVNAWDGILDDIHDGELSYAEAAAVTELANVFNVDPTITSFNELQYFTGLTEIDDHAFSGCYNLSAITLPSTVAMIGDYAFENCSSLQNIVIPPGVTTIGHYAFRYSGLTEADLPYSVATIGALAFGDCDNLVSVYIHASVTNINGNAFTGAALANIEVDVNNPVYDSRNGCNAIIHTATNTLITGCKNTVIPDGITTIDVFAFENCSGLTDIILPATVETIKGWAFNFCTGLATIEVYATTPPTLEEYALMNLDVDNIHVYVPCGSLEVYQNSAWSVFNLVENCNIVFEDPLTKQLCVEAWDLNYDGELSYREAAAVTHFGGVFQFSSITRFNELQYFTGLYEIHQDDFTDCVNLTTVTFPPTVIWIKSEAFMNCFSLASITFGENIGTIYNYAFENCTGISFVKVEAMTPPTIGEYAFYGVETANIPVYVPCGTKSDYQNDSDWNVVFNPDNFIDPCAMVTQTVELGAGWNWFSLYVEVEDPVAMLDMLKAGLGDNALYIEGAEGITEYEDEEWFGDLDEIGVVNEQSYTIYATADCTVELQGIPANPAEHVIYINQGWNRIGFPCSEEVEIAVALGEFDAEEGDQIEGPEGYTEYDGEEWFGDIETLVPGQGYMYFSNSVGAKTLVFQTGDSKARAKNAFPKAKPIGRQKPDLRIK